MGRKWVAVLLAGMFCFGVSGCLPPRGTGTESVLDRAKLGTVLSTALNHYWADHDEYPPYLFGDTATPPAVGGPYVSFGFSLKPIASDPLIQAGYMHEYPVVGSPTEAIPDDPCWPGVQRWRCAFSTPGDYTLLTEDGREMSWQEYLRAEWQQRHRDPVDDGGEQTMPSFPSRLFTLGARLDRGPQASTAFVQHEERKPRPWYSLHPYDGLHDHYFTRPRAELPFFGYQRGEWLSEGKSTAWLWLYGSNWWSKLETLSTDPEERYLQRLRMKEPDTTLTNSPPKGLDLLNAETGELVPDGIPDGICLLYKLKEGEVVEVIRAEGI